MAYGEYVAHGKYLVIFYESHVVIMGYTVNIGTYGEHVGCGEY